MTYIIGAILSTGVALQQVQCSEIEFLAFQPPANLTCEAYVGPFVQAAGGSLQNPESTDICMYCPVAATDAFLKTTNIFYDERWRNFGLIWIYIVFNVAMALCVYWLFRVPKRMPKLSLKL